MGAIINRLLIFVGLLLMVFANRIAAGEAKRRHAIQLIGLCVLLAGALLLRFVTYGTMLL